MLIRPRRESDLDPLLAVLAAVHETDGYPVRRASVSRAFLTPNDSRGEWVAEISGSPVGQVALVAGMSAPSLIRATGHPPADLAGIARLFVAPWARGRGVAQALMAAACDAARRADLEPVLDVVDGSPAAALYERLGWRLVGKEPASWLADDGSRPTLRLYIAPP